MLRAAQSSDLAAVYNLVNASSEDDLQKAMFARTFVDQLNQERHKLGVYEEDGQVLGFIGILCTWQLHHGVRVAEIKELVVDKDHRNGTIRGDLLAWAEDQARFAGCERIAVTSRLSHPESHQFYMSCGMEETHYRFEKHI